MLQLIFVLLVIASLLALLAHAASREEERRLHGIRPSRRRSLQ